MDSLAGVLGGAAVGVIVVVLVAAIVPLIFYLISLQKAINSLKEKRPFAGGLVWLSLIPVLGWIWLVVLVILVPVVLNAELTSRGLPQRAGLGVSIALVVCSVLGFLIVTAIAAFVLWIIHWVKVAAAKNALLAGATPAA